ncbi:MAG: hypothetical protein V1889_01220 [archaeon]
MEEPSSKVQLIAQSYYARKEIQKAMFEFCKHRETVPNFNNKFFGKRPDTFDYPQDILNLAKQGATSFHTSEEIWQNPLDINTDMTPVQYNEARTGWDFLIDIDSPFLDYGKIAAKLLIKELERHDVKNYGIKFSGSKGFHIIIPFKAFPKEFAGEQTKNKFPEWPRIIAAYLFNRIKQPMNQEILKLTNREKLKEKGELTSEHICPKCRNSTEKKLVGLYKCPDVKCKGEVESMKSNRKEMICPSCNGKMKRVSQREIHFCQNCKINTANLEATSSYGGELRPNKTKFKVEDKIKSTQDAVDIVLVSSRHLFRAPYSLHEKTALASIPITKDQIENFKLSDADPLKIAQTKSFMPDAKEDEAKELLLHAIDWHNENKPKQSPDRTPNSELRIPLKNLEINSSMFPPIITKLLKGMKDDGRKRALSLLLSFFTTLEFPQEYIENEIAGWNKKNYQPLRDGYIKSQINWFLKNKRLPPNYDKPIYKEFGINSPPEPGIKNPINYTIRKAIQAKQKSVYVKPKENKAEI